MNQHIHEECGVFGIFAPENKDVAALTYYGLYALQHRGQEGCGIAVNDDGVITYSARAASPSATRGTAPSARRPARTASQWS